MFKVGDKVICVNNKQCSLKIENIYYVLLVNDVYITVTEFPYDAFLHSRFITLKEYRKQKLEKICLK